MRSGTRAARDAFRESRKLNKVPFPPPSFHAPFSIIYAPVALPRNCLILLSPLFVFHVFLSSRFPPFPPLPSCCSPSSSLINLRSVIQVRRSCAKVKDKAIKIREWYLFAPFFLRSVTCQSPIFKPRCISHFLDSLSPTRNNNKIKFSCICYYNLIICNSNDSDLNFF